VGKYKFLEVNMTHDTQRVMIVYNNFKLIKCFTMFNLCRSIYLSLYGMSEKSYLYVSSYANELVPMSYDYG